MLTNPIVIKKESGASKVISLLSDTDITDSGANTDIIYLYNDFSTASVTKICFILQNGVEVQARPIQNTQIISDPDIIKLYVPEGDIEESYTLWPYSIPSAVLANLVQKGSTQTTVAFKNSELGNDTDYLGVEYTASELDATINAELKVLYPDAVSGNWVNVYQTTSNTFFSWLYDGTDFNKQTSILNTQQIWTSIPLGLNINASAITEDEEIDVTVTEIVLDELAEISQIVEGITGDITNLMLKADYDPNDYGDTVEKARNVDDGTNSKPAREIIAGEYDQIDFNAGNTGGQVSWNNTEQTTDRVINSVVTLQDGRELLKLGRNTSGVTITNGSVVAIIGSVGNVAEIELLDITDLNQSFKVIGIATEDIDNNSVGNITLIGRTRGIDTSAWAEGTILYAGLNGTLTDTIPEAPNRVVLMSVVETSNAGSGVLWTWPRPIATMDELSDTYVVSKQDGDFYTYNETNSRYELDNINNYKFEKNGWTPDITNKITVNCIDATNTVEITATEDIEYYIQNVKYTFSAGTKSVVIPTGTSSEYFITLGTDGNLVASTVAWDFIDIDYVWVAEVYWNDTASYFTSCAYEFHSYAMPGVVHRNNHFGTGTYLIGSGGAVSDAGNSTINVTQFTIGDEDIVATVIDNDTPTLPFEQPLSPLQTYKYYRLGASEIYKINDDTDLVYYNGSNVPYLNPFDGSVYSLVAMTNNRYGAYWVVYTTSPTYPVKIFLGQNESDTLNNAIEDNGINSMNFGAIPIQEIKVAYRVLIKYQGGVTTIEQIDNFIVDPQTGTPQDNTNSHGALLGLGDDDHTQYFNESRLGLSTTGAKVGYDGSAGFTGKTNVQDAIDQAKTEIDQLVLGEINDNSITNAKLVADIKIGSNATYQTNTGSTASDVYEAIEEVYDEVLSESINKVPYTDSQGQDTIPKNGIAINISETNSTKPYNIEGLTLSQVVSNGNFANGATGWSGISGSASVVDGRLYNDGTNVSIKQVFQNAILANTKYVVIYDYELISGGIGFNAGGESTVLNDVTVAGSGTFSKVFTTGETVNGNAVFNFDISTEGYIDNLRLIPLANKNLESATADEIAKRVPVYFENLQGITDLTIDKVGLNKFDKLSYNGHTYLMQVLPSEDYVWSESIEYKLYDINQNVISTATGTTVTTTSATYYISFATGIVDTDTFMLIIGTSLVDVDYEAYITSQAKVEGTFHGLGGLYDDELTQRFNEYTILNSDISFFSGTNINLVRITRASITDLITRASDTWQDFMLFGFTPFNGGGFDSTSNIGKSTDQISATYLDLVVDKTVIPDLATAQSTYTGEVIIYVLDEYLPRTEANNNLTPITGELIMGDGYTYSQSSSSGIINEFSANSAYNLKSKLDILETVNVEQGKEIKALQSDLDTLEGRVDSVETKSQTNEDNIGNLDNLTTTNKNDLVNAISEVKNQSNTTDGDVSALDSRVTTNEDELATIYKWEDIYTGTAIAVQSAESSPTDRSLDVGKDFDDYTIHRITFVVGVNKVTIETDLTSSGNGTWIEIPFNITVVGGNKILYGGLFRRNGENWNFYKGYNDTNGSLSALNGTLQVTKIQGGIK